MPAGTWLPGPESTGPRLAERMYLRFGPTNGATYDPARLVNAADHEPQSYRQREPIYFTDNDTSYFGDLVHDPAANYATYKSFANRFNLGINTTPYHGKCHAYVDDGGPCRS